MEGVDPPRRKEAKNSFGGWEGIPPSGERYSPSRRRAPNSILGRGGFPLFREVLPISKTSLKFVGGWGEIPIKKKTRHEAIRSKFDLVSFFKTRALLFLHFITSMRSTKRFAVVEKSLRDFPDV